MRHTGFRILAEGQDISNDTWATGLNNNDVIIGPSGSGKTRGYVMPNLLQLDGSLIVTDTKGALRQEVGSVLEQHGYQIIELNTLCEAADQRDGHKLQMPVRFILDDFAANVCIPDFDRIISVIRSREIAVSVIIQSLSQLEALYGHARALTILNNCDNLLYLGGQDVETASFIAKKANKTPSTILQMPLDAAWLFTRGTAPREVTKYRLESHPLYEELPEYRATHMAAVQVPQSAPEAEPAA